MVVVSDPLSNVSTESFDTFPTPALGLTIDALRQHILPPATASLADPQPHPHLLSQLLRALEPLDFRQLVGRTSDSDKLKRNHYVVAIAEEVVASAQRLGWDLCRCQELLYAYNGACWQELPADELRHFLQRAAEKMGVDHYEASFVQFGELLLTQFMSTAYVAPPVRSRDTVLINLANGTFQIQAEQQALRPFAAADFLTYQLPFAYDPACSAPGFQQFLDRVLPDVECQHVLAEYIGYLFVSPARLKLEKTLLLYGSGANGKSVFFEVITALLGSENVSHYALQSLTIDPAYSRANLAKVLVNYASELGGKLDANVFKQLVSGEPVEVRLPYGKPYTMSEYGKLLFNCNELPTGVEFTPAFFRRFLIIPFEQTIPLAEQDPLLATRLIAEERSGIFNWVLAGLQRLLRQGNFTASKRVQQQVDDYQTQADSVRSFLKERGYQPHADCLISRHELYAEYKAYCLDEGAHPVGGRNFTPRLENAGIQHTRRSSGLCYLLSRTAPTF
jgi:putative DNA primase/helicase